MSRKGKGTYVELGNELDTSLRAFCDALHGAKKSHVMRDAIVEFIERELQANDGLRERYESIRKRERRISSAKLSVVDK